MERESSRDGFAGGPGLSEGRAALGRKTWDFCLPAAPGGDARFGQVKERALENPHGDLFYGAGLFRELKLCCLTFKIKVTPCFFAVITFSFHSLMR